jgi:hypothetical protein
VLLAVCAIANGVIASKAATAAATGRSEGEAATVGVIWDVSAK